MKAELLVDCRCTLGEGPVWDEGRKHLWWLDIEEAKLHQYIPDSNEHIVHKLPEKAGSFAFREQGGFVMAGERGWSFYDAEEQRWQPIADPEPHLPRNRFNDGKCDSAGRFYAGTASLDNRAEGALYVLQPDLRWERLADGIVCSNGITWSADGTVMYYIDSYTRRIDRLDVDVTTGRVSNRRTLIRVEEDGVLPDGMTSDEEGMLWVAEWGGWKVSRWNPAAGERLMFVEVPAAFVTSCTFGGEQMDELFITTAASGLTAEERERQPLAGGVFRAKVGVKGQPFSRFKG